jgi:methyltransferase-like protein/ubiquinone/menaquinone biosynthesis C-methylase UbiE
MANSETSPADQTAGSGDPGDQPGAHDSGAGAAIAGQAANPTVAPAPASDEASSSYDDVPYLSYAYPQTHPDRLNVIGKLFGMEPPPVETARVLELGCASGGNLMPMAEALPNARFHGIDKSKRQIEDGERMLQAIGLDNITLEHCDLMDFPEDAGEFDYIIVHGIYSWVPEAVQKRILEICQRHLSAQGIAYVSYNIYPGWHMRGMLRDMMVYHCQRIADPGMRVAEARALIDFLQGAVANQETAYAKLLTEELNLLKRVNDSYIFHEHLEDNNRPVYFHEFNDAIRSHALQYLGEANFHMMLARNFQPKVAQTLRRVAGNDLTRMEQYMDFVRNGHFRQTLIVREDVELKRDISGGKVAGLYVASAARLAEDKRVDPNSEEQQNFVLPTGAQFSTSKPLLKRALPILRRKWPDAMPLNDLAVAVTAQGDDTVIMDSAARDRVAAQLATDFLFLFSSNMAEVRPRQVGISQEPTAKPRTTALIRWSAANRRPMINLRHETLNLNDLARHILTLMDGTRDEAGILDGLVELAQADRISVQRDGQPIRDTEALRQALADPLHRAMHALAEQGFVLKE